MAKKERIAETHASFPMDDVGPAYVLQVYDRVLKFSGIVVIDNLALGVGKGGIRMTPTVTVGEVFRLARAMTYKNALAGLPFGGAKSGIVADPRGMPREKKKAIMESFARMIKPFVPRYYIAGPDVNTGEQEMQWFAEANGSWRAATGKPANYCMLVIGKKGEKCGLPHEFGSTGFGVAESTKIAAEFVGIDIRDARVAIAGFGNVGTFAFKFLKEAGANIVAVSDQEGAVYSEKGLSYEALMKNKERGRHVSELRGATHIPREKIYELPVDILIPAAVTDVIHGGNVGKVRARIIVEGANIPMQEIYEEQLAKRGVLIVPDIIANAGGVISSYAEYRGYNPKRMFDTISEKIGKNVRALLTEAKKAHMPVRKAALRLARKRIEEAGRKKNTR